jgi:hypothetical protein
MGFGDKKDYLWVVAYGMILSAFLSPENTVVGLHVER